MNKILLVFGTRPELIKLAPIVIEFQERNQRDRLFVINTSQHTNFMEQNITDFNIKVDYQFVLNRTTDSLSYLNGLLLTEFHKLKLELINQNMNISAVIAQGDTCTTFSAAQFSFYENVRFIHIEAGLRTYDFHEPFPEEYYRKTISTISSIHFAPTPIAKQNLLSEGIAPNRVKLIGNTVIDNLRRYFKNHDFQDANLQKNGIVLITIHRRENIKDCLTSIINQIIAYCKNHPNKSFVWIDNPGYKIEPHIPGGIKNLKIIKPVSFFEMMELYKLTSLIITDSGGIQEEATYLRIPTLLFRNKTERLESIDVGIATYFDLNKTDLDLIISSLDRNKNAYSNTIYGDGFASKRLVDFLFEAGI